MRVIFKIDSIRINSERKNADIAIEFSILKFDLKKSVSESAMKNYKPTEYEDYPTAKKETDIYELTNTDVLAKPDSNDATFSEVINFFFKNKQTGELFSKFARVAVKIYDEEDNFEYIGQSKLINLQDFISKKDEPISLYI
jgi:hypothetical protein